MEDYTLFKNSLLIYHFFCIKNDLPINFCNPILIQLEFLLDELHYAEKNINIRIGQLCNRIDVISNKDSHLKAFIMYSIVQNVYEKHLYYFEYEKQFIDACVESSKSEEESKDSQYWLSAWSPIRVVDNQKDFFEGVNLSREKWISETTLLKKLLYNIVFQPPYNKTNNWQKLRGL